MRIQLCRMTILTGCNLGLTRPNLCLILIFRKHVLKVKCKKMCRHCSENNKEEGQAFYFSSFLAPSPASSMVYLLSLWQAKLLNMHMYVKGELESKKTKSKHGPFPIHSLEKKHWFKWLRNLGLSVSMLLSQSASAISETRKEKSFNQQHFFSSLHLSGLTNIVFDKYFKKEKLLLFWRKQISCAFVFQLNQACIYKKKG